MPEELNEIRRSQVITTFGPGSIVDFRAGRQGGAPVSVVICGLDGWDKYAQPAGLQHQQTTSEPRLERLLHVDGFRLPPAVPKNESNQYVTGERLPAVRFPRWLHCPECHCLKRDRFWNSDPGDPALYCGTCSSRTKRRVHVVPARFILVCEDGHLDEFPWDWWVRHKDGCDPRNALVLRSEGAGLAGLVLRCTKCGQRRSMDGCFGQEAMTIPCMAYRPWLGDKEPKCERRPRAVLRGASNVYFPVIVSALDIPPWSDRIQKHLGIYWHRLVQADSDEKRLQIINALDLHVPLGLRPEQLLEQVRVRMTRLDKQDDDSLRFDEYTQLTLGHTTGAGRNDEVEFETRPETVPPELSQYFEHLVRVTRLREVRVIRSFTRLRPPADWRDGGSATFARITLQDRPWLPATEVRGEGIFIGFKEESLRRWSDRVVAIQGRAAKLHSAYVAEYRERHGKDAVPPRHVTPRLLLIHSFAHAIIRQLSLECGYSTASLRERLYIDDDAQRRMAGVLVYTATPDSDGTLGGLSRQGKPNRLVSLVEGAVRAMEWCSSDPLCIDGIQAGTDSLNGSACHACMLAPETSCEEFNRLLDRAALVGFPADRAAGYFSPLLSGV